MRGPNLPHQKPTVAAFVEGNDVGGEQGGMFILCFPLLCTLDLHNLKSVLMY